MTTEKFNKAVTEWIASARQGKTGKLYTRLAILELLAYLEPTGSRHSSSPATASSSCAADGSGSYSAELVVGRRLKPNFKMPDRQAMLVRLPAVDLAYDKAG